MSTRQKWIGLLPAVAAINYPFFLKGFHAAISSGGVVLAAVLLLAAFAMPLLGFAFAFRLAEIANPMASDLRARRLAYASIAAPPLFVFTGVAPGLVGLHVPDIVIWIVAWLAAALYVGFAPAAPAMKTPIKPIAGWRVVHGVAAAIIACFILFHLVNHLSGLDGPQTHKAIMAAGRKIYRAPFVEPVLVALLLFQAASGIRLAWRWSGVPVDAYRIFQVGSGAYLAGFILAHLNSALISARTVHHIETDWAWASGAPSGLLLDAWNIRLLPHYALGVFFILGHLASGLRVVMLAHGINATVASRFWIVAVMGGALIAAAIIAGLCGVRI
ncbi:MAG: hypothetical protein V4559_02975 [Pseudomonadota bacterium]